MSDYFQSYVFGEPIADQGSGHFQGVATYLLAEEIIGEETGDNAFEGRGHVPGRHAASIMIEDNDHWRMLSRKGVYVGEGRIIEFSTRLRLGRCPQCRVEIETADEAFLPIDNALSEYHEGRSDDVECPNCGARRKLSEWDFDHGMAVGRAMVKFWNWPDLIDGLEARFEDLAAMKCTKVWGRF